MEWDSLLKKAFEIENSIDQELDQLGQMPGQFSRVESNPKDLEDLTFQCKECIEYLESNFSKLSGIVSSMSRLSSSDRSYQHMCERHQSKLRDLRQEFSKIQKSAKAARDRAHLIAGTHEHGSSSDNSQSNSSNSNNTTSSLLTERDHIFHASSLADNTLENASNLHDQLMRQGKTFSNIGSSLNSLSDRLPGVRSVLRQIDNRKRREAIILAALIAILLFIMFLLI
eukprot:gb/GECH01012341.1/.p1 GENE.gb/GECH01012341.1/~~gb/GECH01012341.1/.p1  ORF type:complete len:227 (+),score=60.19 gb/GECH01012341.1/:1-681(+)